MTRPTRALSALALTLALGASTAHAQPAEAVSQTPEATLRLAVQTPAPEGGRLAGALQIDLEPGWKTYWIDPGPVGLAPHLDLSASTGLDDVEWDFPAPVRFAEGDDLSIGYDGPVAFPFTAEAGSSGEIVLSAMIGVCRTLCVPLAVELRRDLSVPSDVAEAMIVDRARLAPPPLAAEPLRAMIVGDSLRLSPLPADAPTGDLFPLAPDGWRFARPERTAEGWRIAVERRPPEAAAPPPFELVATGDGTAPRRFRVETGR